MKLKNLFIALLVVCAMVSCAKDAEKGPGKPTDKLAKLSVKSVATKADTGTTADKNELPGEAKINNLTAFIFNEGGTELFGMQRQTAREGEDLIAVEEVATSSFENISFVLVANTPEGVLNDVNTLTELQAKLAELSSQVQGNLTMSSPVITTEDPLLLGENYIGYGDTYTNLDNLDEPVVLTRITSRISLVGTKTKFAGTELEGRTVTVDSIYLTNVKPSSKYISVQDWGSVEAGDAFVYDAKASGTTGIAAGSTAVDYLHAAVDTEVSDHSPADAMLGSLYAFENTSSSVSTRLVVRVTLLADDAHVAETRYFSIPVKHNADDGSVTEKIKRNYVYKIYATITDKSFSNDPANATLDVKITVAQWGVVNQESEVD